MIEILERDEHGRPTRVRMTDCDAEWTPDSGLSLKAWTHSDPCDPAPDDPDEPEPH